MRLFAASFLAVVVTTTGLSQADEGMWLFNRLPKEHLKQKYGFEATEEWANHVMRASVRFNSGGSASFVSGQGLVLTNHHVGADTLHKLSSDERNVYKDGYYAKTYKDELKAPDLELNQLVAIQDVTERVNGAIKPGMSAAEAAVARRSAMAKIEKESLEKTKLRSDVVTLYGGAEYHLYRYKKYTDVRLVWAPESAAAFFGGDPDNFEYPRFCLDVCLFRVYEDGKPAKTKDYFKFSKSGAAKSELVFVSGNPGRTRRIYTSAALRYQRDVRMPFVLNFLRRREILLQQFGFEGDEQTRRAKDELFGIQNARKAYTGMINGLLNPEFFAKKDRDEAALKSRAAQESELKSERKAWDDIESIVKEQGKLLDRTASFASQHFDVAETLVMMAIEDEKPSDQRLREYRDSARPSLEQQLYTTAPIYMDLEFVKLSDSLALFAERRGSDDPLVKKVLAGKSPQNRAAELLAKSQLRKVAVRREIAKGGLSAIKSSKDPFIQLALTLEPEARKLREATDALAERERQAYASIAKVLFAEKGTSTYPDATFTLRLAFGPVKGYVEQGKEIPPWTTMGGAFDHEKSHGNKSPWQLPKKWHERKSKINPDTPYNFVCTADIIGGNSGSPVINQKRELVGIIFDGNIHSLTADYLYTDQIARAVSVHSSAVLEALDKIYQAERIVKELKDAK